MKTKFKVGDKVRMPKEAQYRLFPKGSLFTNGIVTKVIPEYDQIRVKRYWGGVPYKGHENNTWSMDWWRKYETSN